MRKTDKAEKTARNGGPDPERKNTRKHRIGIRGRLIGDLAVFVAFVISLLWVFQILFLDDFYRYIKTRRIAAVADAIIDASGTEDLQSLAEQLALQHEVCVLMLDGRYQTVLSCEGSSICLIHRAGADSLEWWCKKAPADGSRAIESFESTPLTARMWGGLSQPPQPTEAAPQEASPGDLRQPGETGRRWNRHGWSERLPDLEDFRYESLLYARRITLADGSDGFLLLNMGITPVNATVSTLREQLRIITLIVVLAAAVVALAMARRFSQPIVETNAAAKQLARAEYHQPPHAHSYREISELNETLEHTAAELHQVENLQHELVANVSHDLRTPLTMIGGYAELMRDIPEERSVENMQIIIGETRRLSTLVDELLDFSRLEAGIITLDRHPFCLTESIREIVERTAAMVSRDGYRICYEPAEEDWVLADERRIHQVVYNLMNNALTYTGEDKTVRILQRRAAKGRVRVEVRDSGPGIPPEELPLIWNRYYRSTENHKRAIQGSGLGLSIVQSILAGHGVPYGVSSRTGEGTCFWFELEEAEKADV